MAFSNRRLRGTTGLLALCACLVLAACGDDSDERRTDDARGGQASLKVAFAGYAATTMFTYVAEHEGYFEDAGLDVSIRDGLGALSVQEVVSGKADLSYTGSDTAMRLGQGGKKATIIQGLAGGGAVGYMVGNPKTAPTIESLRALDKCRIATFAAGTVPFGYAKLYAKALGGKCDVVPYTNIANLAAAVIGGQADAGVASYQGTFAEPLDSRRLVSLIDTRDPSALDPYLKERFVEAVEFGLADNLEAKRDAIVRYLQATNRAREFVADQPPAKVAQVLRSFGGGFAQIPEESMAKQITAVKTYAAVGNSEGQIDERQWAAVVAGLGKLGTIAAGTDAGRTYGDLVDMSYFEAARDAQ